VVHAGLEMLRIDLSGVFTNNPSPARILTGEATMELLHDIYLASESAVLFLEDIVNYENIESGTAIIKRKRERERESETVNASV
jgi:hypothetical protein